ncbi:MAG: twin-arginine translocation signal domain-containing protein [Photobacterium aquimaris]|nr:twin-arginine translocation signal domain-containing protein [Photobacterium aquimaris]
MSLTRRDLIKGAAAATAAGAATQGYRMSA